MSIRTSPTRKREAADKLLTWLKDQDITTWPRTYDILTRASLDINEAVFVLWKAFDLLIQMGRIERNSPNGQKGARVVDWRPLAEPAKPKAGGLVLLKVPQERLDQFGPGQIEDFKRAFPDDIVVIIALDSDLMVGKAARAEMIRLRDEIDAALKEPTVPPRVIDPEL